MVHVLLAGLVTGRREQEEGDQCRIGAESDKDAEHQYRRSRVILRGSDAAERSGQTAV
jgi:hypothetical protein